MTRDYTYVIPFPSHGQLLFYQVGAARLAGRVGPVAGADRPSATNRLMARSRCVSCLSFSHSHNLISLGPGPRDVSGRTWPHVAGCSRTRTTRPLITLPRAKRLRVSSPRRGCCANHRPVRPGDKARPMMIRESPNLYRTDRRLDLT